LSEKLNIVGRRSGKGFVAHRHHLVEAFSRVQSPRVELLGFTLGTKGLVNFLRLSNRSNIVRMIPTNGKNNNEAKRLRIEIGNYQTSLSNYDWTDEKTSLTIPCDVKVVSTNGSVQPNVSVVELASALARVIPFASRDKARPPLNTVYITVDKGKLSMVCTDGYVLAMASLGFAYDTKKPIMALIDATELRGIMPRLKKARRVRVGFEASTVESDVHTLLIDTESNHYRIHSAPGEYPDYQKVVPSDGIAVDVDCRELLQAVASIGCLTVDKDDFIILSLDGNVLKVSAKDDKGNASVPVLGNGNAMIALNNRYLSLACKRVNDMATLHFPDANNIGRPIKITTTDDSYMIVIMPMVSPEVKAKAKANAADTTAKANADATADTTAKANADADVPEVAKAA